MSMNYETVIDSYAWIEYFKGSSSGVKARGFIEKGSAATSSISLAELQEKYLREKWDSFDTDVKFITTKTTLVSLDRKILDSRRSDKLPEQEEKERLGNG